MDFAKLTKQLNEAKKITIPRTAILWGREDLLGKAVESILTEDKNWQVIRRLGNPDVKALIQEVEKTNAEVIIINRGFCADAFPTPVQIIEKLPTVKIITVNPDNNLVEIYNKQKVSIEEVSDLLSVIDHCSNPTVPGGENKPQNDRSDHLPASEAGQIT